MCIRDSGYEAGYYIAGSNNTIVGAYKGTSADSTLNDTVIISAGTTERARCNSSGTWQFGGVVESTTGGFKFPDGTTQTTASSGSLPSVGTAPNEIPINQYLGQQAFVDEVGTVRPSATEPQANKDINFQYVSDTSIKIRMRGADGTVRSTTLTLS